jgi:hypothetical protein
MAYANSTLLYGWIGDDAKAVVQKLTNDDCKKLLESLSCDENNGVTKDINGKLKGVNLEFNIFSGGLGSGEFVCYLHFGNIKTNQSCSSDDISSVSFTIRELKKFMAESFTFKRDHPGVKQPQLIHLTVADEK